MVVTIVLRTSMFCPLSQYSWHISFSILLISHILLLSFSFIFICFFFLGSGRKTCNVGGKTFGEGDRLKTADPCLECQCSGGRVDCRLRVCPKLPRPPPPNCFLLERPQSCCATMLCSTGVGDVWCRTVV